MAKSSTKTKRKTTKRLTSKSGGKIEKIDKPMQDVLITQLTPELLATTWLSSVFLKNDGVVELENSWTELILDFLGMLFERRPATFMAEISRYNIISDSVNIHREIIKYPESSEIEYELYKLNNISGYYVEFRHDYSEYIRTIRKLLKALGIGESAIRFNIKPIELTDTGNIAQIVSENTLSDLINQNKQTVDIVSIEIFGSEQSVKSMQQALYVFLMWAKTVYGDSTVDKAIHSNTAEVGVTTAAHIDEYDTRFKTYKLEDYYIYCSDNDRAILLFIYQTAMLIGISPDLIVIKHKILKGR